MVSITTALYEGVLISIKRSLDLKRDETVVDPKFSCDVCGIELSAHDLGIEINAVKIQEAHFQHSRKNEDKTPCVKRLKRLPGQIPE